MLVQQETLSPFPGGFVLIADFPRNSASCSFVRVQNGLYETVKFERLSVSVGREVDDLLLEFATSISSLIQ